MKISYLICGLKNDSFSSSFNFSLLEVNVLYCIKAVCVGELAHILLWHINRHNSLQKPKNILVLYVSIDQISKKHNKKPYAITRLWHHQNGISIFIWSETRICKRKFLKVQMKVNIYICIMLPLIQRYVYF